MMKRIVILVLAAMLAFGACAETDKEIMFRDTKWGISYSEARSTIEGLGYSTTIQGEDYIAQSVSDLITGSSEESKFDFNDINIYAACWPDDLSVAGYPVDYIVLHFAYLPIDGILTHEDHDTALYAAQYVFVPTNFDIVSADLKSKLESIYGEISKSGETNTWDFGNEWYVWNGINNTGVSLNIRNAKGGGDNQITISYFTYDGDEWLYVASDAEKERVFRSENTAAQSGDTSGL